MFSFLAIVGVLLLAACGPVLVAMRLKHRTRVIVRLAVLCAIGFVIVVFGLVALAFNGYVEDSGMEPAHTLGTALPVLLVGGCLVLYAWWTALGDPK